MDLMSKFLSFYKNKVTLALLFLLVVIILFAPANLVFSENIRTPDLRFRGITAFFIMILIPLLLMYLSEMIAISKKLIALLRQ